MIDLSLETIEKLTKECITRETKEAVGNIGAKFIKRI